MTEEQLQLSAAELGIPTEFQFVGRILKTLVETGNSYPTKG
jgi:hypothetical protein